jgi:hypothetical protein
LSNPQWTPKPIAEQIAEDTAWDQVDEAAVNQFTGAV